MKGKSSLTQEEIVYTWSKFKDFLSYNTINLREHIQKWILKVFYQERWNLTLYQTKCIDISIPIRDSGFNALAYAEGSSFNSLMWTE